jgi:hypothetical protein
VTQTVPRIDGRRPCVKQSTPLPVRSDGLSRATRHGAGVGAGGCPLSDAGGLGWRSHADQGITVPSPGFGPKPAAIGPRIGRNIDDRRSGPVHANLCSPRGVAGRITRRATPGCDPGDPGFESRRSPSSAIPLPTRDCEVERLPVPSSLSGLRRDPSPIPFPKPNVRRTDIPPGLRSGYRSVSPSGKRRGRPPY